MTRWIVKMGMNNFSRGHPVVLGIYNIPLVNTVNTQLLNPDYSSRYSLLPLSTFRSVSSFTKLSSEVAAPAFLFVCWRCSKINVRLSQIMERLHLPFGARYEAKYSSLIVSRYSSIGHSFHSTEMFFRVHSPLILGQGSAIYSFRANRRALNSITEIALNGRQAPVSVSWSAVSWSIVTIWQSLRRRQQNVIQTATIIEGFLWYDALNLTCGPQRRVVNWLALIWFLFILSYVHYRCPFYHVSEHGCCYGIFWRMKAFRGKKTVKGIIIFKTVRVIGWWSRFQCIVWWALLNIEVLRPEPY